jgi:HSP20 family protein
MADIRGIRLKHLHGRLGEIAYQLTQVQFSGVSPDVSWHPAINAYRCPEKMTICVDLAGVDRSAIDLQVEPRSLRVRGRRQPPEPLGAEEKPVQILAIEIDHGPFEREVNFPSEVDPERVTAEQKNGLLWIYLPLRSPA